MLNDFRYAFRGLRQNPGFALTAILLIAMAIGATSAIFSLADGVLLRPLPLPNPWDVVSISARTPSGNFGNVSYADYTDFRDKSGAFDGLVAYSLRPAGFAKNAATQPQLKEGFLVSGNFFQALGVEPSLGRGFRPEENQVAGRDAVVVLSHALWKSEFAGDPAVVGRRIRLNGADFAVIGVAPESFTQIHHMLQEAFYVPAAMGPAFGASNEDILTDRSLREFFVKGRLNSGTSIQSANAQVDAIARSLEQSYPKTNHNFGAAVLSEMDARAQFSPGDRPLINMLFVLVAVVLAIACANLVNLMLNRNRARMREVAVRLAVGASRWRLVRQIMAECLLIALAGGALGLLIAQSAIEMYSTIEIPGDLPLQFNFQLDHRVLAFTLLVSIASALLFGLAPALQSTRTDLVSALKSGQSDQARKRFFGRRALVVLQVAGSLVLVVMAAQLYRAIGSALTGDLGFRTDHRITMRFAPESAGLTAVQSEQFYKTLIERARNIPGIKSAALDASLPMTTNFDARTVMPEGYQFPAGQEGERVLTDYVSDHYFDTFGIPMLAGRSFLPADLADSPQVAIVNEEFAKHFLNGNPVGKRIRIRQDGPWVEVVGMSGNVKQIMPFLPPFSFLYLPHSQQPQSRMTLIAETYDDPARMAGPLKEMVHSINANVPVFAVRTMENLFEQRAAKAANQIIGTVGTLALIGLALALIGLYAVVAYQVSRKTREIGIRIALGAAGSQVIKMILKHAATMAVTGVCIGTVLSIAGNRILSAGLSGAADTRTFSPILFATIPAALLLTTLLAAAIPAWRAARVDPMQALRQE